MFNVSRVSKAIKYLYFDGLFILYIYTLYLYVYITHKIHKHGKIGDGGSFCFRTGFCPEQLRVGRFLEARHLALLIDAHLAHHSVAGARAIAAMP